MLADSFLQGLAYIDFACAVCPPEATVAWPRVGLLIDRVVLSSDLTPVHVSQLVARCASPPSVKIAATTNATCA